MAMTDALLYLRSEAKLDPDTGCWLWTGRLTSQGYAMPGKDFRAAYLDGRYMNAHRAAWVVLNGDPVKHDLHHVCERRTCVRPDHLQPIDRRSHLLMTPGNIAAVNAVKTACPHGHAYTPENTYVYVGRRGRMRFCITCRRERRKGGASA
jgi:hypothetical protein